MVFSRSGGRLHLLEHATCLGRCHHDSVSPSAVCVHPQNEDTNDKPRARFHAMKRLKRAAQHAAAFEALCAAVGSSRTSLEADAYAAWMTAHVALMQENWGPALEVGVADM